MLKTPDDFSYDKLVDSLAGDDYVIAQNDAILYRIYANNGYKLIDLTSESNIIYRNEIDAVVESDDSIKMPLLGRVKLAGLTVKKAEEFLQQKYSKLYIDPFVNLKVTNKRVIVFPGNGGQAKVLNLSNNNTTVIEALANAGGVLEDGKAYKIKLIRKSNDPAKAALVYLMDLSTIEGIRDGNRIVQAGDIVYVEPRYKPLYAFSREVAPLVTLLTSVLLMIQFSLIISRN
jgi:polysaccharide export outer membrane protein